MNALERKVLELIGEDPENPDVFTDDEEGLEPIRNSLNDAIQEIVILTGSVKRQYIVPLRQEQQFYRIRPAAGSFGWVTDAWLVNQRYRLKQTDLIGVSSMNPRWMTATGSPGHYLPIGADVIGVYPKPGGDGDALELTIVEVPSPYAAGGRAKMRDVFQYAIVSFAAAEYWASRGDANEALDHMGRYLDALGLRQRYFPNPSGGFQTRKEQQR